MAIQLDQLFLPPFVAAQHLLGTDELGRDIFSRLLLGVQVSLLVGFFVLLISGTIGVLLGMVSGWCGGRVDMLLMRITEVFLSFPGILIAIAFAALSGPGLANVVLALGLMGWVTFARLARVQTLALKNTDFINAALISGVKRPVVLLRYVLPNIAGPLIVEAIFTMAGAMLAEAGLSFLGVGLQPPAPSLGAMLREGGRYMLNAPHLVIIPGAVLMALVLAFYVIGDKVRGGLEKSG